MIKIIKEGRRKIRECKDCGCVFSFDPEDVYHYENTGFDKEKIEVIPQAKEGFKTHIRCPQCYAELNIE